LDKGKEESSTFRKKIVGDYEKNNQRGNI